MSTDNNINKKLLVKQLLKVVMDKGRVDHNKGCVSCTSQINGVTERLSDDLVKLAEFTDIDGMRGEYLRARELLWSGFENNSTPCARFGALYEFPIEILSVLLCINLIEEGEEI